MNRQALTPSSALPLAFANMVAAALLGIAIGLDRAYGLAGFPPLATAFAHAHLAVIGWPMMTARGGQPPARAANALPTPRFARPIFLCWTIGVPWLAWGLATGHELSIRLSAVTLLAGVITGAMYLAHFMRAARAPRQ